MTDLLPSSIRDESSAALAELLKERWDALPVERVLVWHVPSTVESALSWLADSVGLAGLRYVDAPPREWLQQAIAFMRKRGTLGGLRRVLEALGIVDYEIYTDTAWKYDGAINYNGILRYGVDAHWSTFMVIAMAILNEDEVRELWDAIDFVKPRRSRFVLFTYAIGGSGLELREHRETP